MSERRKSNSQAVPSRAAAAAATGHHATVDVERAKFVTGIMNDLNKRAEAIQESKDGMLSENAASA